MIKKATVQIKGARPMLWHKFGPESLPLEKQEKRGVPGNDPLEWQDTVLCLKDTGQLYIRPDYVFSCLRDGARYTKKGRGSIQTAVVATLQVTDDRILIDDRFIPGYDGGLPSEMPTDDSLPVYLDIRGVVNPSTRGRNVRYRVACSPGWTCTFHILWEATIVGEDQMRAVLTDSGNLVGLGNGRKIGFGRFEIVSVEITD